ncbi:MULTISPECIES: YHS domain-containing (seleno)protein [unclassified Flavobacterium]|uniref:YHS domain-containing (seleno)protein n=1 Tax=unclassified Flavobacterium TaxID=196869 RepID=UPI000F0C78F7|nr:MULTISPECIES: YHS domain-containing (seleno)protein [unclassified Flavobacterium]AYN05312.1 YHS domain protein [Flavobacterium sp. 140616W15]MCD0473548.1 YHS domain protein [Flavobacterium sp. EDS]
MKKIVAIVFVLVSITMFSQNDAKRITQFNLDNKVAIQGYDPVAYFKQNKAIKGKDDFKTSYMGVTYKFSSATNKDVFIKNPTVFEPQFGGWCAFAMGDSGDKVKINPETFKIIDEKLYLFYNAFFNNTLKRWNEDEINLKAKAENNWKRIYK